MNNKVLFVDDDPDLLAASARMFHGEFEIETALGGEEGLKSIRDRGPFSVVVSDVAMPGMDGIEFITRVREVAPQSVRLIMTGSTQAETAIRAVNEGHVFSFLTKPCSKDELAKAIAAAFTERDKQRAPRLKVQLPVQLFRSFTETSQIAHTLNISASGARLGGLKESLRWGEVLDIQCGTRKAPFQVVWIGSAGTPTAHQAGVQCLTPHIDLWEMNFAQEANGESLMREIALARTVQRRLFPQEKPALRTLDYSGHCLPARIVGGDYYDFLETGSGEVGFVVADVAGKGVAASLLMANLQGVLHSKQSIHSSDLPRLLASINRHFHTHTENHDYVTVFFGCYNDENQQLRYVNCGHNPPILLRRSGTVERLGATATVLGLFPAWECSVAETELESGDLLTIFTDGVTEAANRNGEQFGEGRLLETLRANRDCESAVILRNVEGIVQQFAAGDPQDDVTLLIGCAR